MLVPEYMTQDKWEKLLILYLELEEWIFQDDAKRLLQSPLRPPLPYRETEKRTFEVMDRAERELRSVLRKAVIDSVREEKPVLRRLGVDASEPLKNPKVRTAADEQWQRARNELEGLTRAIFRQGDSDLARMLNEADMMIAAGLTTYDRAYLDVLDKYAEVGMMVEYPSGARRSIEGALRACIMTSMNQTAAQISNLYIKEAKAEYVLVSAHIGARIGKPGQPPCADHMSWQGKVYKIKGSEDGAKNLLEETGYDIDDDGIGFVVDPLGLHGYNCRHSHKAWDKDLKNPYRNEKGELLDGSGKVITEEENRRIYELTQKQRAMERGIRKTKRQIVMKQAEAKNGAKTDTGTLEKKLIRQNKAYNDFCRENGLPPQYVRNVIAGERN